jgi:hypothetical protein
LSACSSSLVISTRRVESCSVALVLLGEVELALLLEVRAGVALTQDRELGPVGAKLLRETPLCGNGVGPIGLLVLRAGGCWGGNLTPLQCHVDAELRKKGFAVSVVLGACVLRLRGFSRVGSSAAACAGRLRGLCCCLQIGAVVVLQEVLVQAL